MTQKSQPSPGCRLLGSPYWAGMLSGAVIAFPVEMLFGGIGVLTVSIGCFAVGIVLLRTNRR